MKNIPPTREEVREHTAKVGFEVNEPYQLLLEPWNSEGFILMDDEGAEKVTLLKNASIMHTAEKPTFNTSALPDGAKVEVTVAGHGKKLELTVCNPVALDF